MLSKPRTCKIPEDKIYKRAKGKLSLTEATAAQSMEKLQIL